MSKSECTWYKWNVSQELTWFGRYGIGSCGGLVTYEILTLCNPRAGLPRNTSVEIK